MKTILFDFWGTLVEQGVWSPLKQVRAALKIELPFSEYVVRMEKAMMTKQFKELKDAFQAVCEEFGVTPASKKIDELVGMWNKNWLLAKPYEETVEVLEKLQKTHQLILISNSDCFGVGKVLEKYNLLKYFSSTALSYEKEMLKTDENFLTQLLTENNLQVEDCLLVGDSMHSDVAPAQKMGMKVVLIDRKNSRAFTPKIKNLRELETYL